MPYADGGGSGAEDEQHLSLFAMVTEQLYRDRAKEARQEAEAITDPEQRRALLEVAKAYEHFADLVWKTPWHVQRVEKKGGAAEQAGNDKSDKRKPTPKKK